MHNISTNGAGGKSRGARLHGEAQDVQEIHSDSKNMRLMAVQDFSWGYESNSMTHIVAV